MQGSYWRTTLLAAALVASGCESGSTSALGDAGVLDDTGTPVSPPPTAVQAWTLRVSDIDFRDDGQDPPGYELESSYGACGPYMFGIDNAFAEMVDVYGGLSTARYPSLDLEALAHDALACSPGPDCAPLRLFAHGNDTGATWVSHEGAGVAWGPLDAQRGVVVNGPGHGDATLEIPALDVAGEVVVLPIAVHEVRLGVRTARVDLIEILVGGWMDEAGFVALAEALRRLGASDELLDVSDQIFQNLTDIQVASGGVCRYTGLSVGFVIRATPAASATP
jgi:hypothetical protein